MKYIKDKDWDTYLLDYLESIKKNILDIPKDPNKGIQFEVLVEYLLSQKFTAEELCFKNTKLSHDGNKDFWAIDAANEVWWAECKNYTPNIALTQLAPTLIMAEINQVSHLMFFSYSSLNANLKKRIAQYSYKYNKEIFLYDDESLEQLIFLYDKEIIHKKYAPELYKPSEKLEIIFFNEINASVVTQNTFDENYEIKELNVGSIYDLNVIFINRYQNTELKVKVTINDHETNLYFDFLNKDLSIPLQEWEDEIILKPNQIALAKYSVLVKKENKKLETLVEEIENDLRKRTWLDEEEQLEISQFDEYVIEYEKQIHERINSKVYNLCKNAYQLVEEGKTTWEHLIKELNERGCSECM